MPFLSVYNNLIQGHVMMRQTRFDTHKRSELKDIYQRIRRMNADQPFYKVDFDADTQKYTLGVKDRAMDLSSALKELGTDDDSNVFSRKAVISTEPDNVQVETLDGFSGGDFKPLEIEVLDLAESQVNSGRMVPEDDVNLQPGQYNFTVTVEDSYYSFQFNVSEGSTNKELQTKLSDFINKTKVGLNARVMSEDDMSRIDLTLKMKGTNEPSGIAFSLQDTKKPDNATKGIVEHFGLNNIEKKAVNTIFTVNGHKVTTREREFVLNNGIKLNIDNKTEEGNPAKIMLVADDGPVVDKVAGFVNKFNSFLDFASEGLSKRRSSGKLIHEMSSTIERYKDRLTESGIAVDDNGRLSVDREKMKDAIRSGELEDLFKNDSPVSAGLTRRLSDISINPMDYIDKKIITYPNTAVKKPYSPYITSVYSGLMYNNYC